MICVEGLDELRRTPAGSVMSIGNFDGVHLGHSRLLAEARTLKRAAGGEIVAVTFEPHPLTVLAPEKAPPRLTPEDLKRELLAAMGVDRLVTLPPTHDVLDISAEDFFAILMNQSRPAHLVEGDSFTFGKDRRGTIDRLAQWARGTSIAVHVVDAVQTALLDLSLVKISSSLIRWLLAHGRPRDAAIALGHGFVLEGRIVRGHQRGRTIGVPTANLECPHQMIPLEGVYAARCTVAGAAYPVALSIGRMPTFGDQQPQQIEAHLIGFDGDLYDQTLRVEVVDWIREQRRFAGIELLKAQLSRDIARAVQSRGIDAARPAARAAL